MRKFLHISMLSAAVVVAFASCQKIETEATHAEGDFIYTFGISNNDNSSIGETRAVFGEAETGIYLEWENGDLFGAYATCVVDGEAKNSNNRPSSVTVSSTGFKLNVATTTAMTSGADVYTYFPYYAGAGNKYSEAIISIPQIQTQKVAGFDATAMPMAGQPFQFDSDIEANSETEVGSIQFANLGSIIKFRIYSTVENSELIKSVEFQATTNLAGEYSINLKNVNVTDASTLALSGGSINTVKTSLESPVAIPSSKDESVEVYMIVAPGSYAGDIIVTTDAHTYTFRITSAKTFNRSRVKPLNADLSKAIVGTPAAEEVWNPVTSVSDFTEGTYVIVSSDKASYLVNAASEKNPTSATAHWDGSGKLTSVTDDAKWIATPNGSGLQFASYANQDNYLWQSTSVAQGVSVGSSSSISGAAKVWSLVANTALGGESGYIATTGNGRYLALYTNGTWRGYTINATSGYLNNSSDIKAAIFYKLADSRTALDTPVLAVNGTVVSWASIANADSYLVTIDSDEYTINTTSVDLADYSLSDGEYTVSVVAVPSNTTQYKNSAAATTSVIIGNASGTSANPYSVSAALAEANKLSDGETTENEVYVSGIVSAVSSYNSTYKSITYSISADGSSTDELLIYGGLDIEGSDFASVYDLAVGDVVVVKGYLKKYGSTLEMDKNNHVISITKVARYTITLGSVSNGSIAASTSSAGAQAVVTLTATPSTGYALDTWIVTNASTNETITVTDNTFTMPAANVNVSATFKTVGGNKTATFTFSSMGYANAEDVTSITKDDDDNTDISLTFDLGTNSSGNNPKYYTTGSGARMYTGNTLVVAGGSNTIVGIAFTFSGSYTGTLTSDPIGYTQPTWTGSSSSVTFTNTGSANRIQKIVVTYE